jgi:uncharacterized protein YndB with AHSA1/START domain
MSTQAQDLAVRKSVVVACSPEHAFETFTARMQDWWPFEIHSPGDGATVEAVFEPVVGGRVYSRTEAGEEHEWATVTIWEPPSRVAVDWHVTAGKPSTQLEVRFVPEGDGTRVELEHRGWESWGEEAAEAHASYSQGWDPVLQRFVAAADA